MLPRYARPVLLLSAVAILGSVSSALGAGRVQEVVPGPGGTVLVRSLTPDAGPPLAVPPNQSAAPAPSSAPAWVDRNHMAGIAEFVALCGDGAYGVAGWWLNGMRTACYRVDSGNGVPVWNHAMPAAQFQIAVAAADGDRMTSTARSESLFVFSSASPQAIFSDWYTPPLVGYKTAISGNGYTYVGGGGNPAGGAGEVRVYDQSGALRFIRTLPAPPEGVGVSQNGLVVVANVRATAWVWDAVTGDLRGSVSIPGECQLPAVLSGDGTYLVTGGFDHAVRLYHWDGASSYVLDWAYVIPGTTWTTALAISADASTIVAGTWTNPTGGKVVAFNLGSPTPIWTDASFGDWVGSVATTADGSKIVAGSWGRSGATAARWTR